MTDLASVTPLRFLEVGGGSVHALSYIQVRSAAYCVRRRALCWLRGRPPALASVALVSSRSSIDA